MLLSLLLVALYAANWYSYNLAFLIYGLAGYCLAIGMNLNSLAEKYSGRERVAVFLVAVIPFFITQFYDLMDFVLLAQIIGLFIICSWIFKDNKTLYFLGRHSLVLYVAHIVLIRLILVIL